MTASVSKPGNRINNERNSPDNLQRIFKRNDFLTANLRIKTVAFNIFLSHPAIAMTAIGVDTAPQILRESHNLSISGSRCTCFIKPHLFNEVGLTLPSATVGGIPPALDVKHRQSYLAPLFVSCDIHLPLAVMVSAEFANHHVARKLSTFIY